MSYKQNYIPSTILKLKIQFIKNYPFDCPFAELGLDDESKLPLSFVGVVDLELFFSGSNRFEKKSSPIY